MELLRLGMSAVLVTLHSTDRFLQLEFSREWNVPVHHFFRRHVYSASLAVMSRPVATVITFFISALAHELVMGCITKKLRGYGAFALLLQMPLVVMQRSKWMRGRQLLNNVLFWVSGNQ